MFRPCIDLHEGKVKQLVGGSLASATGGLRTNFVSDRSAAWYAELYKKDGLQGGHVIMLGHGNEDSARGALAAYRAGLQIGGGINASNASAWLEAGASHVILTSWLFPGEGLDWERLKQIASVAGKKKLVIDLSCRRRGEDYFVVTNLWRKFTSFKLSKGSLERLTPWCEEFLIHAVDVEGLCRGIDEELVSKLADWSPLPTTYAGGANALSDLETVTRIGRGKIDLTIGSALDIFGGTSVRYADAVAFNRENALNKIAQ